jgi:hypothetical protein
MSSELDHVCSGRPQKVLVDAQILGELGHPNPDIRVRGVLKGAVAPIGTDALSEIDRDSRRNAILDGMAGVDCGSASPWPGYVGHRR